MAELRTETASLKTAADSLKAQLEDKLVEAAQLSADLADARRENDKFALMVEQLNTANTRLNTDFQRVQGMLTETNKELDTTRKRAETLAAANAELAATAEKLRPECDRLRQDLDSAKVTVYSLEVS